jgi:hypothetical protein
MRGTTPVGHLRVFNKRALRDLLESQGFRPVRERGAVFPAFPGPVRAVDRLFTVIPGLASILVVLSERIAPDEPGGTASISGARS